MVELLLAMAGTGFVAVAISSMLFSVSYGTTSNKDLRKIIVREKITAARVTAAIRESNRVLATGDGFIVLWVNDDDADGQPKLSELRRIERVAVTSSILSYRSPASIAPADDTVFDLATSDFEGETDAVKGTADFPAERWATDVSNWTISINNPTAQLATLVSFRLTLQGNGTEDISIFVATLRN